MTFFLFGFTYYINIINLFFLKNKRILTLLFPIILIILYGGNTVNPDYSAYEMNYLYDQYEHFEIGYTILEKLFFSLGISYNGFRLVLASIGITLIHTTVKKIIPKRASLFYILYSLYPFMMDVVQVRNFLAMSIFIFSIHFLIEDKKNKDIKYIITIIIASLFQKTALIYLPFIFFLKIRKTGNFKLIYIIAIGTTVALVFIPAFKNIFSNFVYMILGSNETRLVVYAEAQVSLGYFVFVFIQLTNFMFLRYSKKTSENSDAKKMCEKSKKFINVIYWLNVYAFMFLPLYIFQATYTRFMRNIFPLNIIVFVLITYFHFSNKKWNKNMYIAAFVLFTMFLFVFEIYLPYSKTIIEAVFRNNWIINV